MKTFMTPNVYLLALAILLIHTPYAAAVNQTGKLSEYKQTQAKKAVQAEYNRQSQHSFAEAGTQDGSFIPSDSSYTLGADDVIEITVLRHPEVSGQFVVTNEGKIQYDFVGDLTVAGLTKEDIINILTEKLSEYIISPDLNVKIIGYNSKAVYVIGEVGRPGKVYMEGDTITIREALIKAGLPSLSARKEKSKLITPSVSGKPVQKRVNLKKLLLEGDLRENLVMKPGDTLYVPPTGMTKVMRTIQPVTAPITNAAGAGGAVSNF